MNPNGRRHRQRARVAPASRFRPWGFFFVVRMRCGGSGRRMGMDTGKALGVVQT